MAGIIAGRETGADPALAAQHPEWFLGVAPDAGIVSVKVGDRNGDIVPGGLAAAVRLDRRQRRAVRHPGDQPLGRVRCDSASPFRVDPLSAAVQRAWDAGLVVVVAAGNDGADANGLTTPANDPYVIAVAGAKVDEDRSPGSGVDEFGRRRSQPRLAAPGSAASRACGRPAATPMSTIPRATSMPRPSRERVHRRQPRRCRGSCTAARRSPRTDE